MGIRKLATALLALAMMFSVSATAEEITLQAISAFPTNIQFTKQFLNFIERVNETGKGVVQIQFIGGPEVVPPQQQDTAIRNGVVDIMMGPATYYTGTVPAGDALFGATASPAKARKNGGFKLLNSIYREQLNAKLLGWESGSIPFYVYLVDKPKMDRRGLLDLSGVRMRSTSAYREFFQRLGATTVTLQAAEIYPALKRGVVDGLAWPAISFTDLGVYKLVNYRVAPPVWQLDLMILMNADSWDALSDKVQAILHEAAVAHEQVTAEKFAKVRKAEDRILAEAGIQTIRVDNPELYKKLAYDVVWERLESRAPSNVDALRETFYHD